MPYVHAWEKDGVYRRFYGELTASELLDSSQKISSDVRSAQLTYDLSDYRQVRHHDITSDAIQRWVLQTTQLGMANPKFLVAMVSADEVVLRVLRSFKESFDTQLSVRIFARTAEARAWIETTRSAGAHSPNRPPLSPVRSFPTESP